MCRTPVARRVVSDRNRFFTETPKTETGHSEKPKFGRNRMFCRNSLISADIDNFRPILSYICRNCHVSAKIEIYLAGQTLLYVHVELLFNERALKKKCDASMRNCI